jgi:hypothetical protein
LAAQLQERFHKGETAMDQNTQAPVRNNILALTAGVGLGAGLMYLFDPNRGRRRRRKLMDQLTSVVHHDAGTLEKQGKNLFNRVRGLAARAASELSAEEPVDDETLVARVRSRMGHVLPDPHEVEVEAHHGVVTLKGKLAHSERHRLKEHIRTVPGVRQIHDRLEPRSAISPALLLGLAAGFNFLRSAAKRPETTTDQGC